MFPEIARPGAVPPRAKPGRAAGPAPSGTTDPLLLDDSVLTLRGEKRSATEDKDRQFPERFHGRFERRIPRGYEIDGNAVEAGSQRGADRDPPQDRKGAVAGQAHPDQGLTPVYRRRGIRPPAALWGGVGTGSGVRRVVGARLACTAPQPRPFRALAAPFVLSPPGVSRSR